MRAYVSVCALLQVEERLTTHLFRVLFVLIDSLALRDGLPFPRAKHAIQIGCVVHFCPFACFSDFYEQRGFVSPLGPRESSPYRHPADLKRRTSFPRLRSAPLHHLYPQWTPVCLELHPASSRDPLAGRRLGAAWRSEASTA